MVCGQTQQQNNRPKTTVKRTMNTTSATITDEVCCEKTSAQGDDLDSQIKNKSTTETRILNLSEEG